ncbi:MAG: translesion error-prone DNA polymerase V autoproteolytic subunit [Undibacterium sp.]|nr:translesion error-prone DNA polymerase V autoproteolytic subunit [Undibacterium sp.]
MNSVIPFPRSPEPLPSTLPPTLHQVAQPVATMPALAGIPLFLQKVPAGFPSPADDYVEESLDLNSYMIRHKASTFVFTVQGDSMTGVGIFDGDKLVVDRAVEPRHQHIVIAVINNDYTVKKLFKWRGVIELRAENPAYQPIRFKDTDELQIWGVVVGVLRRFKV